MKTVTTISLKRLSLLFPPVCISMALALSAQAATVNWSCTESVGYWSDTGCWDTGAEPQSDDSVYLTHDEIKDVTVIYDSALSPSLRTLRVDATTPWNAEYIRGTTTLKLEGDVALSAAEEWIGTSSFGKGAIVQSAGTNTASNLVFGLFRADTYGSYDLSGTGILTSYYEYLGYDGDGVFTQSGGIHNARNTLWLGYNKYSDGSYDLSDGELSAFYEYIGREGTGVFSQSGGTHRAIHSLTIGLGSDEEGEIGGPYNLRTGIYNLSGTGILTAYEEMIGDRGIGIVNQSGGSHSITTDLVLGNQSGASGSYDLSAGALSIGGSEIVGNSGNGAFTQLGGMHSIVGDLTLGEAAGSDGRYVLEGGGELSIGGKETIAHYGAASFIQSGGIHSVSEGLSIGNVSGSNGYYELTGGELHDAAVSIGGSNGVGVLYQTGGSHTVAGTLFLGSDGVYELEGGSLFVKGISIENDSGRRKGFFHSSGTVTVADGLHVYGHYFLGEGNMGESLLSVNDVYIGSGGGAGFTQFQGAHNIKNSLTIGSGHSGLGSNQGYYLMYGGELSVGGDVIVGNLGGVGLMRQTGGDVSVDGTLWVAKSGYSDEIGVYELQDGTLNTAAIEINRHGRFEMSGGVLNAATVKRLSYLSGFSFSGGELHVDNFVGDLVNSGGTLAPGHSPGTTFIDGNYQQYLAGIFEVEIGGLLQGEEYDWLDISGTARLGGTLDLDLIDLGGGLFMPELGDMFDVLSAEEIIGGFDFFDLADPGTGLGWEVNYLVDEFGTRDVLRLSVVAADDDVTPVPEPTVLALLGLGLAGVGFGRKKKLN